MSGFKEILVCSDATENIEATLETALLAARRFNSHIDAVHIHKEPTCVLPVPVVTSDMAGFAVTFLFPKEAAATALTVMFLGDTAAALFGRKYGKHKINDGKKSVEGSLAFFSVSLAVLYFFSIFYDFPALVWMTDAFGGSPLR